MVKSREMVDYFQRYLEIFNGDEIPEPKSIFNTTAEVLNLHAMNEAKDAYMKRMESLRVTATSHVLVDKELVEEHKESLERSIELFSEQSRFGGETFSKYFKEVLERELQEKFNFFRRLNDSKIQNVFHKAKDSYITRMEAEVDKSVPLHAQDLKDVHEKTSEDSITMFQTVTANGTYQALSEELLAKLIEDINTKFHHYRAINNSKIHVTIRKTSETAIEQYCKAMEEVLLGPIYINEIKLEYEHRDARRVAMEAFGRSSSYGTELLTSHSASLAREVEEKFAFYRDLNNSKRLGKRMVAIFEQVELVLLLCLFSPAPAPGFPGAGRQEGEGVPEEQGAAKGCGRRTSGDHSVQDLIRFLEA